MVTLFCLGFASPRPRIRPSHAIVILLISLMLAGAATRLSAQTKTATTTALTATAGGAPATSIARGTMVTLTATVSAGPSAITRGQVNFCDASATYCTDIHILGMAQITSAGTATLKLRPGVGNHSYKAVFLGTNTYASSASGTSTLTVTGKYPTTMLITTLSVGIAGSLEGVYAGHATLGSSASTAPGPTDQMTVSDTTGGNTVLQTEPLGTATVGPNLVTASNTLTGTGPGADVAGDFNGDGNLDLAVGLSSGTPPLSILLGDGTGKFTPAPASSITVTGTPLLVQDFNCDGIPDILLSNGADGQVGASQLGGRSLCCWEMGTGRFGWHPGSPIATNSGSYPVVAADFNGDGLPDLALAGGNFMVVLLGNGDGTFTQVPINSSSISGANRFVSMVAGDFDGDGIPDLAVLSEDNAQGGGQLVSVLLGNGDGTFQQGASVVTNAYPVFNTLLTMVTADFNGDGKLDLAVPYLGNGNNLVPTAVETVTILLGNGSGMFEQATGSPISVNSEPNCIGLGDVNGDGIADLLLDETGDIAAPTFLVGNGDGTFRSIVTSGYGLWDNFDT